MITRLLLAACLAVAVPAQADPLDDVASGFLCSSSHTDLYNNEYEVVEIDGGPLVAADPDATVSLRCALHAGRDTGTHAAPDAIAVSSPPATGVTVLPPTVVRYPIPQYDRTLSLCSQVIVDGVTHYWDDWVGEWSISPDVPCREYIYQDICDFPDCTGPSVDLGEAEPVACPVLGQLAPGVPGFKVTPEGDVRMSDNWKLVDCAQ